MTTCTLSDSVRWPVVRNAGFWCQTKSSICYISLQKTKLSYLLPFFCYLKSTSAISRGTPCIISWERNVNLLSLEDCHKFCHYGLYSPKPPKRSLWWLLQVIFLPAHLWFVPKTMADKRSKYSYSHDWSADSLADPSENCHLNVKKLPKT